MLTCGVLDYQNETPLEDVLSAIELPAERAGAALSRGGEAEVFDLKLNGVRITLCQRPTAGRSGRRVRAKARSSWTWPTRCSRDFGPRSC